MINMPISEMDEGVAVYDVYGLNQQWKIGEQYSYKECPRPNNGIFFLKNTSADMIFRSGEKQSFKRGSIVYIPKGINYIALMKTGGSSLLVNFDMKNVQNEDVTFSSKIKCMVSEASLRYTEDIEKIVSVCRNANESYLSVMSAFYNLLDNLSQYEKEKNLSKYEAIAPAIIYMDNHVNDDISVGELAKMCLISESGFRRKFHEYTGTSPVKYRISIKLEKAKKLLTLTDLPVSGIASELGFYDTSYFCRVFETNIGLSPMEYRKSIIRNF